jgi:hypothetical protein
MTGASIRSGRWTVKRHLVIALQPDGSPGGLRGSAGMVFGPWPVWETPGDISSLWWRSASHDVLTSSSRLHTIFVRNTMSGVLLHAMLEKVST